MNRDDNISDVLVEPVVEKNSSVFFTGSVQFKSNAFAPCYKDKALPDLSVCLVSFLAETMLWLSTRWIYASAITVTGNS